MHQCSTTKEVIQPAGPSKPYRTSKYLAWLGALAVLALMACAGTSSNKPAPVFTPTPIQTAAPTPIRTLYGDLGRPIDLAIGQQLYIRETGLRAEFLDVTEDSRCPKNVECVWAGQVRVVVTLTPRDSDEGETVTLEELGSGPGHYDFQGHKFTYHVQPYPQEAGKPTSKEDYRLVLQVFR